MLLSKQRSPLNATSRQVPLVTCRSPRQKETPVEALGFGLPVLTTRCTAIPETTLGLASYVDDPLDAGEWAARIIAMTQAPAAHAPSAAEVALLRSYYAPERIAERYLQALLD